MSTPAPSPLPIRTLPVIERWDCHSCGNCCRGSIIPLDEDDLAKLRDQDWESHPDFRSLNIIERTGVLSGSFQLARRDDGSCVFLTEEGMCRIHQDHGEQAKPLVCRMFPFQAVPLGDFAYLTTRRICPSAAADLGRPLSEHRRAATRLLRQGRLAPRSGRPPMITKRFRGDWEAFLSVTEAVQRLVGDQRYPLVRRLVHMMNFCEQLESCRPQKVKASAFNELIAMLESSATEDDGQIFQDRQPPKGAAPMLFRQAAAEYLRLHPGCLGTSPRSQRRHLSAAALAFVKGKGTVPELQLTFPTTTFEALERPIGMLEVEVNRPLLAYFQTTTASREYAILGRKRWALVDSCYALALTFPVALWMLRFACGARPPTPADTIDIISCLDRGQGYAPLSGGRHRWTVGRLARSGQLARLLVWYAR
ncbi:MAG: YkgJ family cysteine cluster protein [Pirellulales bacterium]|nr:YkgJ family cysteine cluster protein [Pirellulales bacterium]